MDIFSTIHVNFNLLPWTITYVCPVGRGCRICQLHLCRGVRYSPQHSNLLTMSGDPWCLRIGSWWLSSTWPGNWVVKLLATQHFGHYLAWQAVRSIGWLCQALAPMFCFDHIFSICTCDKQAPNLYLLGVRRQCLRVNSIERIEIWSLLNYTVSSNILRKTWTWWRLKNLLSAWVYWSCISILTKACPVSWGCRMHLCRGVRPPPPTSVLIMTLNNLMVEFQ